MMLSMFYTPERDARGAAARWMERTKKKKKTTVDTSCIRKKKRETASLVYTVRDISIVNEKATTAQRDRTSHRGPLKKREMLLS